MGNCCSQKSVLYRQETVAPKSKRSVKFNNDPLYSDSDSDSNYVAPDFTDVLLGRLGSPRYTSCKDLRDDISSPANLSSEEGRVTIKAARNRAKEKDEGGILRKLSDYPRLIDMILVRDLWRSRIISNFLISHRYSLSPNSIGFGVGGSVKQIVDRKSHRTYALKSLKTITPSRRKLTSVLNEVAIYTQLDHPNIAYLHEVYDEVGVCHLVMEHCTGNELYDRLDTYKRFSEGYTKYLTVQMLLALNYLHSNGICHRDLKLENWVFSTSEVGSTLKMIDFGFARLFAEGVPMGGMHGTVYYVDPEVIDGCYSEKCDLWSTGVIVYMLLSGSPPFNGDVDREILMKIKKGGLKFEGIRWNQVSETAKDFIRYMLNRNVKERPSAIQALRHPWLREEVAKFDNNVIPTDMLRHIVEFSKKASLHRVIVALCVLDADRNVNPEIYRTFFSINSSITGLITLSEFTTAMQQRLGMNEQEAVAIFDTIAYRGTPCLHYTEFLTAVYEHYNKLDIGLLSQVYRKLDAFGNGSVNGQAFESCIGEYFNGIPVRSMFTESDYNGKGTIDFARFCDCIISVH